MNLRAAIGIAALATLLLPGVAVAGCPLKELPSTGAFAEAGLSSDSLTQNRTAWSENYLLLVARDALRRSAYARVADDRRFGTVDTVYEGGFSVPGSSHLFFNAAGSFSPQHVSLPQSTFSGGLDARAQGGYGYQVQYTSRSYPSANAATTMVGADRYFRDRRLVVSIAFSQLSNVPGTALSESLSYARYLPCDSESLSVGTGRDVESTGAGSALAVFHTYTYDINDVHWFSNRFGVNLGAGWYLLGGAYNRFEVRFALRQRL